MEESGATCYQLTVNFLYYILLVVGTVSYKVAYDWHSISHSESVTVGRSQTKF